MYTKTHTMNHLEKLEQVKANALLVITTFLLLQENQKHFLLDITKDDWQENEADHDAFYQLPCEMVQHKYFAGQHNIYVMFIEEGEVFFTGWDEEEAEDYKFKTDDLSTYSMCYIADNYLK
jgi:hypothetical protein